MSEPVGGNDGSGAAADAAPIVRELEICNKKGLHARASAKFVQTVEKFDADVRVRRCGENNETVGGTSIVVEATGKDAAAVVEALTALINSRFGEDD